MRAGKREVTCRKVESEVVNSYTAMPCVLWPGFRTGFENGNANLAREHKNGKQFRKPERQLTEAYLFWAIP